jgi:hypothetical protein
MFALSHGDYSDVVEAVNDRLKGSGGVSEIFKSYQDRQKTEDAIITSDGQVIETDPEDSIYAFKGSVSIAPANQMREYSGGSFGGDSDAGRSRGGDINNFFNNSNYDFTGMLPVPVFDPVGV